MNLSIKILEPKNIPIENSVWDFPDHKLQLTFASKDMSNNVPTFTDDEVQVVMTVRQFQNMAHLFQEILSK